MSDTIRIIKKYPNRRLYDTAISSYITINDIRQLVIDQIDFQVVDAKTNKEITRSILLQIISEQEEAGSPIFDSDMLSQFIRIYGNNVQTAFSNYLNQSLRLFVEQYSSFNQQFSGMVDQKSLNPFAKLAEQNIEALQSMQKNFFQMAKGWDPEAGNDSNPKKK